MRYIEGEGRIVWSASDLKVAAECEFAWLRAIDARLGRVPAVDEPEDLTLARAGRLGGEHERRVLAGYRSVYGDRVIEIAETRSTDAAALAAAVAATDAALASDAAVIYQAAFSTDDFVGFADFLVREPSVSAGEPARWIVQDTKLARHARVTALMQLAAYVAQLDRLGVERSDRVELLLGDGTVSTHEVDDLMPVFVLRRARLKALIADRRLDLGSSGEALAWGDTRGELAVLACGRCATCDAEVLAHRDLLLVAGMRPVQRDRLRAAGVTTIDDLAVASVAPPRMSPDMLGMLRTQARLQLASPAGVGLPALVPAATDDAESDSGEASAPGPVPVPTYEVVLPQALGALPRPDDGDLFFDFEGDPLYTEAPAPGAPVQWGIDYLFGWVDMDEQYTPLWAHSFEQERAALEAFVDIVKLRRMQHPGMHIYHYAPYEPTHLLSMAARYGTREADVDRLLSDGVFVDLYPVVRRALRVGSRSYSIKKLEPLYMGAEVRTSDVQKGDDSIVKYVQARALQEDASAELAGGGADGLGASGGADGLGTGDGAGGPSAGEAARAILDDLADYNRYDCVSTRRLRDWLVDRAREAHLRPSPDPEPAESGYEPSARALALSALARDLPAESAEAQALRLGAAAIDYYPREAKTFWATHFLRMREPVSIWEEARDVVILDHDRCRVIEDWHRPEGARVDRRVLELRGELSPGTRLSEGSDPFALYDLPAPFSFERSPRFIHADRRVQVIEVLDDGAAVSEFAAAGVTWSELPLALTPPAPPRAGNQQSAINAWADGVISAAPALPRNAASDLLCRQPPRTLSGALVPAAGDDVDAITRSLLDLDRSYLAVQGPPGTGKTYVGSHVIARLVHEHGWRIGVVAQSHAVVEHMLDQVVNAGVPASQVAKAPKNPAAVTSFTAIPKNGMAAYVAEQPAGFVVGGTAWDFSHEGRIARGSLDLLVIDEAGQFSLASTIAVSLASPRLLLLGDPQQLPQVSQGTHPEPVDTSALGWVMDGSDVIPAEYGYFLGRTWRMHPAVAGPVSKLSYRGELASHPSAGLRSLEGVEAGVIALPVRHRGNATQSPEEATVVVDLVRELLGSPWTGTTVEDGEPHLRPPRPLDQSDLIVVTPYNAQQVEVEQALAAAGFDRVPVGTVDKFQGQEAVVAIVSLAASSGRDAPRGLEFLLLRNRLNVAISRAMHTAYLVYSPGLLDDLPRTPEGVARLSGFSRLVGG